MRVAQRLGRPALDLGFAGVVPVQDPATIGSSPAADHPDGVLAAGVVGHAGVA